MVVVLSRTQATTLCALHSTPSFKVCGRSSILYALSSPLFSLCRCYMGAATVEPWGAVTLFVSSRVPNALQPNTGRLAGGKGPPTTTQSAPRRRTCHLLLRMSITCVPLGRVIVAPSQPRQTNRWQLRRPPQLRRHRATISYARRFLLGWHACWGYEEGMSPGLVDLYHGSHEVGYLPDSWC